MIVLSEARQLISIRDAVRFDRKLMMTVAVRTIQGGTTELLELTESMSKRGAYKPSLAKDGKSHLLFPACHTDGGSSSSSSSSSSGGGGGGGGGGSSGSSSRQFRVAKRQVLETFRQQKAGRGALHVYGM
jgi:uncharacterized membrane protein YgcG